MRHLKLSFICIIVILLVVFSFVFFKTSQSASTLIISPDSYNTGDNAEYCFGGQIQSDLDDDDFIDLQFKGRCTGGTNDNTSCVDNSACTGGGTCAEFDLTTDFLISDTAADSELTIYVGTLNCSGGTDTRVVELGPSDDIADRDEAVIIAASNTIRVIMDLTVKIDALDVISFKFADAADAGNTNALLAPGTAGNYELILGIGPSATMQPDETLLSDLLYIGGSNVTQITATVDPAFSLTLSDNTCDLGTFGTGQINTCGYYITVSLQATGGYTAFIKQDQAMTNGATNTLDDDTVADYDDTGGPDNDDLIHVGTEEYGVSTTESDAVTIVRINNADADGDYDADDCSTMHENTINSNASNISDTAQSFAYASAPVTNDRTDLCHAVAIDGATEAGVYSHQITITVIADF